MEKSTADSLITESKFSRFFGVKAAGSTVRTEIVAGIVSFLTMAYILMVNAGMLSATGVSYNAIYIATALGAIIGTLLMAFLARLPFAQAPGMGINAFFTYTICLGMGFTYQNALVFVLFDGFIFVILTVTGLRKQIFKAIPKVVREAISAGIGLFIAFLGLQDAGIIVNDNATLVGLHSLNLLGSTDWASIMPILVCFAGLVAICVLSKKGVKGATLYGILGSAVLYYLLGFTVTGFYSSFSWGNMNPFQAFKEWGEQSFLEVFLKGFNFKAYIEAHGSGAFLLNLFTSVLAFTMVDMFDTIGTLVGTCSRANMLTPEGEVPNMNKAMLSDAIATCTGAICGTSTVTTFVESSAGIAEGGRTGLTSLSTAICFVLAMFLAPIARLIPSCATSTALIYVGILMVGSIRNIDWSDIGDALPAFTTVVMIPFTYNISYGIGLGIITYCLMKLLTGKAKEISFITAGIGVLFILTFFLTH